MYKSFVRPLLFLLDAETAHHFSFSSIRLLSALGLSGIFRKLFLIEDPRLEREVFGIRFKNPVGLAAGFDKDAKLYNEFSDFGFGFIVRVLLALPSLLSCLYCNVSESLE